MANAIFVIPGSTALGPGGRVPHFYVADTDASKPATGVEEADLCYCIDSNKLYVATAQNAWTELGGGGGPPEAHAASHQNGGSDEISVAGLSGVLADAQTPATHNILSEHNGFPGGTTNFLRADGSFAAPAGTGTRESLVGMWTEPSTKTNIGTSFVDVYVDTNSAGRPVKVDFASKTQYAASIQWDKIGAGTQNVRAVDADNVANVLFDVAVVSGDNDVALASLPAWATGVKRIKLQCKSTTSADDPVFRGGSIRLK